MGTGIAPARIPPSEQPEEVSAPSTAQQPSKGRILVGVWRDRLYKVALGVWRSLPSYLAFYLLVLVTAFAAWQGWKRVMVISTFQMPDKANLPFSGDTVANALQDRLAQIADEIDQQKNDKKLHPTDMHSLAQLGSQIPAQDAQFAHPEVPTRYAVEVKGLSYQGIIAVARAVMGTETTVSGDLVLVGKDGRNFILIARTESRGPWQSDPYPQTAEGLNLASKDLAEKILENLDPALAGALFLKQGRAERALAVLKQASDGNPKDLGAKLRLCQGMEANEFYKDAVQCYEVARNMGPEVEERLARARWLKGDRELGLEGFEELAHKRHYTRALISLGIALDDMKKPQEALSSYKQFLSAGVTRDPWFDFGNNESRSDLRSIAIAHMSMATADAELKRHEDALAEFQKALDTLPGDALVLVRRGMVLADAGDLDAGITELQGVVEKNESADVVPFALFQLGVIFERKGEWEKAAGEFRTATERRPDWGEAHNRLAKSLTRLGRFPEARSEFGQKAKLSSNLVERKYAEVLGNQWLGNALQDLCNYDGAASAYQRAIDLKPDNRIAYIELGHVFERQGQSARAIEEYRKALAAKPNELDVGDWLVITDIRLGEALLTEGNDLEAISRFSDAIEHDQQNFEAHYGLALAFHKQGREQEAAAQCEAVNKVLPDDPVYHTCPRQPAPWERANTSCSKRNSA